MSRKLRISSSGALYAIKKGDDSIKVYYSRHGDWVSSLKGKLAAELSDSGDGAIIYSDGPRINLDYSQLELLEMLLKEYANGKP